MSTAREELAGLIVGQISEWPDDPGVENDLRSKDAADAILAAGWQSPAQVQQIIVRHDRAIAAKDREIAALYELLNETEKQARTYTQEAGVDGGEAVRHGDPEPDYPCDLTAADGRVWARQLLGGWRILGSNQDFSVEWADLSRNWFPMTKVGDPS